MSDVGLYMYAITRKVDPSDLAGARGLRGASLRVVEHEGLTAVVSEVDLDEFGEQGLRRNLEDLAWLEEVARGHDEVVHRVSALGATAPMRLATICRGEAGVAARLEDSHDALVQALDRVEGRAEWSVKVFAPPGSPDEPAQRDDTETPTVGAGAAYLQRKRADAERRRSAAEDAMQVAEGVHHSLCGLAVASRRLQPQDPRLTGHEGTMTLNGAYLVEAADGEAFAARVKELAAEHPTAHVECNGPWPPYSFATLEEA